MAPQRLLHFIANYADMLIEFAYILSLSWSIYETAPISTKVLEEMIVDKQPNATKNVPK